MESSEPDIKVVFEYVNSRSEPLIQHCRDKDLTVKFAFQGGIPDTDDTNFHMIALFKVDEMIITDEKRRGLKCGVNVPLEDTSPIRSVTFSRQQLKSCQGEYMFHYLLISAKTVSIAYSCVYFISEQTQEESRNEVDLLTDEILAEQDQAYSRWRASLSRTSSRMSHHVYQLARKEVQSEMLYQIAKYEFEASTMKEQVQQLERENRELRKSRATCTAAHPYSPIFVQTEDVVPAYRYSLGGIRIPASPKLPWPSGLAPHAPRLELLLKEVEAKFKGYESDDFDRNGSDDYEFVQNEEPSDRLNVSYECPEATPKGHEASVWPKPHVGQENTRLHQLLKNAERKLNGERSSGTLQSGAWQKPWPTRSSRLDQLLKNAEAELNDYNSEELDQHSSEDYEFVPIETSLTTPSSRPLIDLDQIEEDAITDTFQTLDEAARNEPCTATRSPVHYEHDQGFDPSDEVQGEYIPLVCYDNSVWSFTKGASQCDQASWDSRSCSSSITNGTETETCTETEESEESETEDEFTVGEEQEESVIPNDNEVPVYYHRHLDSVIIQIEYSDDSLSTPNAKEEESATTEKTNDQLVDELFKNRKFLSFRPFQQNIMTPSSPTPSFGWPYPILFLPPLSTSTPTRSPSLKFCFSFLLSLSFPRGGGGIIFAGHFRQSCSESSSEMSFEVLDEMSTALGNPACHGSSKFWSLWTSQSKLKPLSS